MANPFYTASGAPVAVSRGASGSERAEFLNVQTGFDKLPPIQTLYTNNATFGTDTGAVNAFAVAGNVLVTALTDGMEIVFKATNANTGATTVNVNALGIKAVTRPDGSALQSGDIVVGQIVELRYVLSAGSFQFLNLSASAVATNAAASATAAAASATSAATSATSASTSATSAASSASTATASANTAVAANAVAKTSNTGSAVIPSGTTAQRDASPLSGYMHFNKDTIKFEGYFGSAWGSIGGASGATGAGQDNVYVENDKYQTTTYTLGQSGLTPATISIATPGVVTQGNTFVGGEEVFFQTTGALPTGLTASTTYFVSATGLTSAVYQVAATRGGASIATSGTQSGIQTAGKAKSAQVVGPLTIATGATLTIPTGQRLVIQ